MEFGSDGWQKAARRLWKPAAIGAVVFAFGLLDGIYTYLQGTNHRWPVVILHVLVAWLVYPALIPLALFLVKRFPLDVAAWPRNVIVQIAGALAFQYAHFFVLHTLLVVFVWPVFYPEANPRSYLPGIPPQHLRAYPIDLLAYWVTVGFVYTTRYYIQLHEREIAAAKLEGSLAEARLAALRRQLSPHFLFNTLNAISVLAMRGDQRAVVKTLDRLSDLLRVTIDETHPQTVPLRNELSFLNRYLDIQKIRFEEQLTVHVSASQQSLDALVPFMIMQPIVENAIEHGISAQSGAVTVLINAAVEHDMLSLSVSDHGPGFPDPGEATKGNGNGNGIGLANTRSRLEQMYGRAFRIECGHSFDGGASVAITIPLARATSVLP